MKIPRTFMGYDGKKELERILNEETPTNIERRVETPIVTISGELSFVTDENLFKEIKKYIAKEFPALKNPLIFADGVMKQSSTYIATAVDMYAKKYLPNFRIATQADVETNLPMFKGNYVDTGLPLRNLTGTNKEQANHLFNQLKQRGVKLEDLPLWLNLRGLELDSNLNFNLTDESVYSTQPSLNWENGTEYSKINKYGLPEEIDESSTRQIWTSNNALSRGVLNWISDLSSKNSGLSNSSDDGRVVFARIA